MTPTGDTDAVIGSIAYRFGINELVGVRAARLRTPCNFANAFEVYMIITSFNAVR